MKKIWLLLVFCFALLCISCNSNRIFDLQTQELPDYHWENNKIISFTPKIADKEQSYKIIFTMRHVYGFQLKSLKIKVDIISPSEKISSKEYTIQFFNEKDEYISDCVGDYCDLTTTLEEKYKFAEIGDYEIQISQLSALEILPNVMNIGLIIEKNVQ